MSERPAEGVRREPDLAPVGKNRSRFPDLDLFARCRRELGIVVERPGEP
jgi:hypothetical protein